MLKAVLIIFFSKSQLKQMRLFDSYRFQISSQVSCFGRVKIDINIKLSRYNLAAIRFDEVRSYSNSLGGEGLRDGQKRIRGRKN